MVFKIPTTNVQYWSLQHLSNAILAVRKVFAWGHFTKMCFAKFPPFTMKASPKISYHKIKWPQFANRNIVGLQFWHSSRHFQIPITPPISTLQLRLGTDYNFGLASTTICEREFSKQNWVKSDLINRLILETLDALMRVSLCTLQWKIWIGLDFLTLGNWPETGRLCLWNWMMIKCIM